MYDRSIVCRGLLLLLWFVVSSAASDVHCKMKPGCTFPTQCDPILKEWSETEHDVEKRLFNKEFPITCSINEIPEIQNRFQKEIEDLKMKNEDLKIEIKVLEKIHDKNDKEIDELKIVIAALKNENEKSIEILNKTHKQLNAEIKNLGTENKALKQSLSKVQEEVNQLTAEFRKKEENIQVEVAEKSEKNNPADCPIFYDNKCYVPRTDRTRNVAGARVVCSQMSAKVFDIYNKAQMDYLMKTIRKNHMGRRNVIDFWSGMTINPQNGEVKLSDGTAASYLRWYEKFPFTTNSYTNIILRVHMSTSSRDQYMFNNPPSTARYTLCEM